MPMFTRRPLAAALTLAVALLAAACGSAQAIPVADFTPLSGSPGDTPISEVTQTTGRIWLEAPTGVYQTGWATLSEVDGSLKVDVSVTPSEAVAQPAHIHLGTCDQLGVVVHSLENVIGGHSVTDFPGISIEDVATGAFSVNLHLSFADFATFTACGEIPALP